MSGLFGVKLHNKINGSNVNYNSQRFCQYKLLKLIFEMYRALIIFVEYHFCEKSARKRVLCDVTVLDNSYGPFSKLYFSLLHCLPDDFAVSVHFMYFFQHSAHTCLGHVADFVFFMKDLNDFLLYKIGFFLYDFDDCSDFFVQLVGWFAGKQALVLSAR